MTTHLSNKSYNFAFYVNKKKLLIPTFLPLSSNIGGITWSLPYPPRMAIKEMHLISVCPENPVRYRLRRSDILLTKRPDIRPNMQLGLFKQRPHIFYDWKTSSQKTITDLEEWQKGFFLKKVCCKGIE